MRLMAFLFPEVEEARKKALARIDAIKAKHDLISAEYARVTHIGAEVMPLLREAEMAGSRPKTLVLTREDIAEIDAANERLFELGQCDRPHRCADGAMLFGVPIAEGPQRSVICEADA